MDSELVKVKVQSEASTTLLQSPIRKIKGVSLSSSIVKPDPPKNLQLKPLKNSRQVEVSWEYPETWSTPHSYFSLTFSIQVQGKNKKERVRCDPGAVYSVVRFMQAHIKEKVNDVILWVMNLR